MKQKLADNLSTWKQQPNFNALSECLITCYEALKLSMPMRLQLAMQSDTPLNCKSIIAELERIKPHLPEQQSEVKPNPVVVPQPEPPTHKEQAPANERVEIGLHLSINGKAEPGKMTNIRINAAKLLNLLETTRTELRTETEAKTVEERAKLVAQIERLDKDYQQYQKVIDEYEKSGKIPGADFAKLLSSETLASELRAARDSQTKVEKLLKECRDHEKINNYRRRLTKISAQIANLLELQAESWQKE